MNQNITESKWQHLVQPHNHRHYTNDAAHAFTERTEPNEKMHTNENKIKRNIIQCRTSEH